MMSYNVEFAEVTGGTFWREYTPGQITGTWATKTYYDFDGTTGRCGSANPAMCAPVITLNGHRLVLGAGNELPDLTPETVSAGTVTIAPGGCTFFVL